MILTIVGQISNEVKISNKVEISNRSARETQPCGSRVREQLTGDETESVPLYSWIVSRDNLVIAINSTIVIVLISSTSIHR